MENSNQVFVVYFENELYGIYSNIEDAIVVTKKIHKTYIDTSNCIDNKKLCIDTKMYYVINLDDYCWEIVVSCKHRNEPEFMKKNVFAEHENKTSYSFGVIAENTDDALKLVFARHDIFNSNNLYVDNEYISPVNFEILKK